VSQAGSEIRRNSGDRKISLFCPSFLARASRPCGYLGWNASVYIGAAVKNKDVLAELRTEVGSFDLLCHPFYRAWTAGELTREDLREYASDYYAHVAAFPTYLSALHSRLPDGVLRRAVLGNLCEEELGREPHSEMWLDFAEGLGAERGAVRVRVPIRQVQELIGTFRWLMHSTATGLAAVYAYESQVPRLAEEKRLTLRFLYGAGDRTCRYFDVHATADVRHALIWKEELARLLTANPNLHAEATSAARQAAEALWLAVDGIEEGRRRRAAGRFWETRN
jgi:pyrroloquinoline-quinone synthase